MISCLTAEKEILSTIYNQILDNHFATFDKNIAELAPKIISATMTVFLGIALSPQFMPTAKKFHYQFNLRDFSKVV
jgi:dynein heavy chain